METEDELAIVLGHEMAHAILKHAVSFKDLYITIGLKHWKQKCVYYVQVKYHFLYIYKTWCQSVLLKKKSVMS